LFVIVAILVVLLGKVFFKNDDSTLFLLSYGLFVTSVTWMTILIAFYFYKDPYEIALKMEKTKAIEDPFVSCMVAVKNEEDNISTCIDSMINQTYTNKEIIVVNDGSTDGTLKILKKYESDGKIKLVNLAVNVGKKRALGKAMEVAKGEIFAHTDSDSVWATDAIERIVKIFKYFPNVGAVSGHGRALNGDKNLLTKPILGWRVNFRFVRLLKAFLDQ
jgi:hyaluronan synthase